jgi:hypothetical protein
VSSSQVRIETIDRDARVRTPYRGVVTGRTTLRLVIEICAWRLCPREVRIDVDDTSVEVLDGERCFAVNAIDQLFVVERQPPKWRFLTWFGVFARRHGLPDCLLVETPDQHVARAVERAIEERLDLADEPVRGELRLAW